MVTLTLLRIHGNEQFIICFEWSWIMNGIIRPCSPSSVRDNSETFDYQGPDLNSGHYRFDSNHSYCGAYKTHYLKMSQTVISRKGWPHVVWYDAASAAYDFSNSSSRKPPKAPQTRCAPFGSSWSELTKRPNLNVRDRIPTAHRLSALCVFEFKNSYSILCSFIPSGTLRFFLSYQSLQLLFIDNN